MSVKYWLDNQVIKTFLILNIKYKFKMNIKNDNILKTKYCSFSFQISVNSFSFELYTSKHSFEQYILVVFKADIHHFHCRLVHFRIRNWKTQ